LRSKLKMRTSRHAYVAVCAVMLAIPATAVALTARATDTQSAIQAQLDRHHVAYGQHVTVTGAAAPAQPGQTLELQFAPAGDSQWQALASTRVQRDGQFKVAAPLRRSGLVRVLGASTATAPTGASASSAPQPVAVAARFRMPTRSIAVLGGHAANVSGKLLPAVRGRRVRLEGRTGQDRWRQLAADRTGSGGGFGLHYATGAARPQQLRVRFSGDRLNTGSRQRAGQLVVFHQSVASWYDDAGTTACGFHAHDGVASPSLPCGTKVQFRHGGRSVTAEVDDRGPFVGGRRWDLSQTTAAALGFGGVGVVWSSI
jgi:rare lipoprotein A